MSPDGVLSLRGVCSCVCVCVCKRRRCEADIITSNPYAADLCVTVSTCEGVPAGRGAPVAHLLPPRRYGPGVARSIVSLPLIAPHLMEELWRSSPREPAPEHAFGRFNVAAGNPRCLDYVTGDGEGTLFFSSHPSRFLTEAAARVPDDAIVRDLADEAYATHTMLVCGGLSLCV